MDKSLYLGGDLGTSALKLTLVDENGALVRTLSVPYGVSFPKPGYSEQEASSYESAFYEGIGKILKPGEKPFLRGISIDGQMHGLVALDEGGKPLRPVILWNDSRSVEECRYLNEEIGEETLLKETGNIAYPGFTLPKILWMRKHEESLYKKIRHVLLPKDYLVYCLTGEFSTDYSDAAGTLMLNCPKKEWSEKMVALSGLSPEALPKLHVSDEMVGSLSEGVAQKLGLSREIFVLAGAGDNAAGAVGVGAALKGRANISLGTSGTIGLSLERFTHDPTGAIHSFSGADGDCFILACMLSSASCLKWFLENVLNNKDYAGILGSIHVKKLGLNEVYFLPYLMGERSPLNDPWARGAFVGMTLSSGRSEMVQAILEGVAFALRQCMDGMSHCGAVIKEASLTGGGAQNPLWRQILADVTGLELSLVSDEGGASYGMALLCLVHAGRFASIAAAEKTIHPYGKVTPDPERHALYEKRYSEWKVLYPALKESFKVISH